MSETDVSLASESRPVPASGGHPLRKVVLTALLVLGVIAAGVAAGVVVRITRPRAHHGHAVVRPAMVVETLPVRRADYRQRLVGYGTVESLRTATLASQVSGSVVELGDEVRVGASVKEGDVLCVVDPATYKEELTRRAAMLTQTEEQLPRLREELENIESRLEVARKDVALAEKDLERQKQLMAEGVSSQQALDNASKALQAQKRVLLETENLYSARRFELNNMQTTIETRRAELSMAKLDVGRTTIVAPFDGAIAMRAVEPGELVTPGRELFRVVDVSRVEVPIRIPASEAVHVGVGKKAELRLSDGGGVVWSGEIARVSPEIDSRNRTVAVYVRVTNEDLEAPLLPGLLVEATLDGRLYPNVVTIPRRAVIDDFSYVMNGDAAERRSPKILRAIGDDLIVEEGLAEGERLIVTNLELLFDGARVASSGPAPPAPPEPALAADAAEGS